MTHLLISKLDRARLGHLLDRSADLGVVDRRRLFDLEHRIEGAAYADSPSMPDDVVTMNSTVRLRDPDTYATEIYTIVYPKDADLDQGCLSILDPMALPLLGKRVGDEVRWPTPGGEMKRLIGDLLFQPERAGMYSL